MIEFEGLSILSVLLCNIFTNYYLNQSIIERHIEKYSKMYYQIDFALLGANIIPNVITFNTLNQILIKL